MLSVDRAVYAEVSKSLFLTKSEAQIRVQRIKIPPNPNSELRGDARVEWPRQNLVFLYGGVMSIWFSVLKTVMSLNSCAIIDMNR